MNRNHAISLAALLAGLLLGSTSCTEKSAVAQAMGNTPVTRDSRAIVSGTRIQVALRHELSSETAAVGDAWHGFVTENVPTLNGAPIPAGTAVDGVVAVVVPARPGSPAMLELGVRSIRVNGLPESLAASTEPLLGSARARTSRGSLPSSARALAAATASSYERASRATRGGVLLNDGTVLSFRVNQTVLMR